jgi:diphthamide biosynthesis protein 2
MRTECRKAGKKTYTFLVGKVNTPKLANFLVVDAYVMLAGTERVEEVVESDVGKFPKAVCGVYELEIALGLRSWDGRLGATTTNSRKEEEEEEEKVESSNTTTIDRNIVLDTQLMNLGNRELSVWVSEAAETLNSRDWKGLEKRNEEEEEDFARVSMGRDGVASMYKREDE